MSDFKKSIISKALDKAANSSTGNNIANKALKTYAKTSDNKIVKAAAESKIVNTVANKALKIAVNNPTAKAKLVDFIDKKTDFKK